MRRVLEKPPPSLSLSLSLGRFPPLLPRLETVRYGVRLVHHVYIDCETHPPTSLPENGRHRRRHRSSPDTITLLLALCTHSRISVRCPR